MIDIKSDPGSMDIALFVIDATIEDYCSIVELLLKKLIDSDTYMSDKMIFLREIHSLLSKYSKQIYK